MAVREALWQVWHCTKGVTASALERQQQAAKKGMEDANNQNAGKWRSIAYLDYIKIPREQLAGFSKLLTCSCLNGGSLEPRQIERVVMSRYSIG